MSDINDFAPCYLTIVDLSTLHVNNAATIVVVEVGLAITVGEDILGATTEESVESDSNSFVISGFPRTSFENLYCKHIDNNYIAIIGGEVSHLSTSPESRGTSG